MMNYDAISKIVIKEIQKSGYRFEEIKSTTTNSIYYKIYSGQDSLIFRISDHKTKKNIMTFRTDIGNPNAEKLLTFIRNRVCDLSYRRVKSVLGI